MATVDDDFFGEQNSSNEAVIREREWNALRKKHVKDGFREGSELGHEAEMQAGFDTGFLAGAKATASAGFWLGASAVVEAFYRPSQGRGVGPPGDSEVVQKDVAELKKAREALEADVGKLTDADTGVETSKAKQACEKIIVIDHANEENTE